MEAFVKQFERTSSFSRFIVATIVPGYFRTCQRWDFLISQALLDLPYILAAGLRAATIELFTFDYWGKRGSMIDSKPRPIGSNIPLSFACTKVRL